MRILLVAHSDAPWTPRYARGLIERGHEVRVISQHPGAVAEVPTVELGPIPRNAFERIRRVIAAVRAIRRERARFRPDVVFAPFLTTNGVAATLSGCGPRVVSARGSDVASYPGESALRRILRPYVVRFVTGRASRVHAVSSGLVTDLAAMGVTLDATDWFCIGVDPERFHPAASAPPLPPRIVSTRKHEPRYDLPTLIHALARLKERGIAFEATLAGGGPSLAEHRRLVSELGLGTRVTLPGALPHAACPELLRTATLYVSTAPIDGSSSSTLEAMATGVLPVLTRIEANAYWVEDERSGLLFRPGDADDLARSIRRGLEDHALRAEASRLNRARIEREGSERHNLDLLERLLASAAHPDPLRG